jgi:hypothetical protein
MSTRVSLRVLTLAGLLAIACARSSLRAEMFFDLSLGASFTQGTEVKVKDTTTFPELSAKDDVTFDPSISAGFRIGGWIDPAPFLGFAFDFSFFQAEGGPIEQNNIFPLSFLVMFRGSLLQSQRHPYGRLQPYAAIGPSTVISDSVVDLRPAVNQRVSTSAADIGLDVRAGLAFEVAPHIAVFAEYRFLYFEQHLDETTDFGWFTTLDSSARATYLTHHVLIGVSFRF